MNFSLSFSFLRNLALILPGLFLLLSVSSCALFSYRARRWENTVSRDPDGVLSHARARTWEGEGPSILMVHGFGDGPHVWNKLGPSLAAEDYFVRAMRLPGWNEPIEVKRSITREDWRQQVLLEMSELEQRNQPVIVIAHSLGACIVSDLVQSGQLTPDALVLYAPLFRVSNARSPVLSSRTWFEVGRRVLPDSFIVESVFNEQASNAAARPPSQRDPFNPGNIFTELFALMDEREARPLNLPCPITLVVTEQDRVIDAESALDAFERFQAPEKVLRRENKAGHALPLDLETLAETECLVLWFTQQGITP